MMTLLTLILLIQGAGFAYLLRLHISRCRSQHAVDQILQAIPVALVVVNTQGYITKANRKAEDILGIHKATITSRTYHSEGWQNTDENGNPMAPEQLPVAIAFRTGQTVHNFRHRTTRPDGTIILLSVTAVPLRGKGGHIHDVLATFEDITEQDALRKSLLASETRFRSLFENMTQGFALHKILLDANGKPCDYEFLEINPAFEKLTGASASALIGKTVKQALPGTEDYWIHTFGKVALSGEAIRYENYAKELGKTYDTFAFSPERGQFAVVFSDISDQKKILRELEEKNEEMTRFTYMVSHDLKTPLITIKSFMGFLQEDLANQDQDALNRDVGYIQKATDKMSQLLEEVLQLSRVGRVKNDTQEFLLQEALEEVQALMAGRLQQQGILFVIDPRPTMLLGDHNRILEVFQNLIENASKFMGDNPCPRIEVGVEQQEESLVIFVRDNGIGIDPKFHGRIFGLFDKLDVKMEGTGLGLAMVKRILEIHGGKIWLESHGLGHGCTFKFTLPGSRLV